MLQDMKDIMVAAYYGTSREAVAQARKSGRPFAELAA
jgi:hypothetical protein